MRCAWLPLLLGLAPASCESTPRPRASQDYQRSGVLVVAPHPDDEVLIASGVVARARAEGRSVTVVVMTNGDYDCVHDGLARQRESIEGLAKIGIGEEHIRFLGYPDGALSMLGREAVARRRLDGEGRCSEGDVTYGRRGPTAKYTREAVVRDLAQLLDELRPADVYITHPVDTHPDHAATYVLFRDALDRVTAAPTAHRAIVHAADCWPLGAAPHEPCPRDAVDPSRPTPPLTGRLAGYLPRERAPLPDRWSRESGNPKVDAIAAHRSQTRGSLDSYLFSFARADEVFFPESFVRSGRRWVRSDPAEKSRSFSLVVERTGGTFTVGDEGEGYLLSFVPEHGLDLTKRTRAASPVHLQAWPLPHDLWKTRDAERFEVLLEWRRADGPIAEISLRHQDDLLGITVDVQPLDVRSVSASPIARPAP